MNIPQTSNMGFNMPQLQVPNTGLGANAYGNLNLNMTPQQVPFMGNTAFNQMNLGNTPVATPQMSDGIFSQANMFGSQGWFNPVVGAIGAGTQMWLGNKQLGLAEDQLAFQKDAFAKNWANQVQLANQAMYDRDVYRKGFSGEAVTQSKDEWTQEHGVK